MTILAGLFLVLILAGLVTAVIIGVGRLRRHTAKATETGLDILPYLLLALAVGTTVFALAQLGRSAFPGEALVGSNRTALASSLAGLVVATPIAVYLWRRQDSRRKVFPKSSGWPVYLTLIEAVFLTAFVIAAVQWVELLIGDGRAFLSDVVIYGAAVVLHWWAAERDRPGGDSADMPRVVGSLIALVTAAIGVTGVLIWLLEGLYASFAARAGGAELEGPLSLMIVGLPIWIWRWLVPWDAAPSVVRKAYTVGVTVLSLATTIGALVAIAILVLTFVIDPVEPGARFAGLPVALGVLGVASAIWYHHRDRIGRERTETLRSCEYAMTALGVGFTVGAATGLIALALEGRQITGANRVEAVVGLGTMLVAAGSTWWWFWRRAQTAPRPEEVQATSRRIYLIGMAVISGVVAASSLIATLVVLFRALLGETQAVGSEVRIPATLTILSGLVTWHLVTTRRGDGPREEARGRPFPVVVVCSHPGTLATRLPREARLQVIHRADADAVVTEELADGIVMAVGTRPSVVWVTGDGFEVVPLRVG